MSYNSRKLQRTFPYCACFVFLLAMMSARAQNFQFVPVIQTYAGGATTLCAAATDAFGDGCPATQAILASPHISDTDAAGNLYITDTTNNIVRRVDATTGIITLFAGGATTVCSAHTDTVGDGCPATQATLDSPKGLRVDAFGNVVIADLDDNRIRSVNAQTGIITTIAGTGSRGSGIVTDGTAANAIKFYSPFDLTFDSSGNLYVADYYDNEVVLIMAVNGAIAPSSSLAYVLAGTGTAGYTGDKGMAASAEIYEPRGITADAGGNIFIADFTDSVVRRVSSPFQNGVLNLAGAIITTYAGNGVDGFSGDNGPATSAAVAQPQGLTTDAAGNLYIAQYGAGYDVIRVVNPATQVITTFAGIGTAGFSGDGGPAIAAKLYSPAGINIDRDGRVFIADSTNNRVRLVSPVTIFPATAVGGAAAASNVVAQATQAVTVKTVGVSTGSNDFSVGTMTGCTLNTVVASGTNCGVPVTFAPAVPGIRAAAVVITDSVANTYRAGVIGIGQAPAIGYTPATIGMIAGTGVAGNTGNNGPGTLAQVSAPRGSTIDASGSLVFADSGNNEIRRIDHSTGVISILAGSGVSGFSGDGGAATLAELYAPSDVVADPAGNLYIADTGNNRIRYVNAATGIISTVAGTGSNGYTGDLGLATAAELSMPTGLALDFVGRLYVADTGNNVIRRFYPVGGYIATIAGTGTAGYSGDGAQATVAELDAPTAIALDSSGTAYIADSGNNTVRKITLLGVISTVAGMQGVNSNSGDGGAAIAAGLETPSDVALDAAGDLYIAAGGRVRMVDASGTISTIAGTGLSGVYSGEGGSAPGATIPDPAMNLSLDRAANLYLSDTAGNLVLSISTATSSTLDFGTQAPNSTSSPQEVTVMNTGNLPLVFSGLTVSANFGLQSTASTACAATSTVAVGASCTLLAVFSPTSVGNITGSVTLTDNALNGTSTTQTIPLKGISAVPANPTTTNLTVSPASLTYGSPVTLTASVTGSALTGSVVFTADGATVGSIPVSNGQAMIKLASLAAGKRTLTATYTNDTANSSSTGTLVLAVQPAVLTVTAMSQSRPIGTANPVFTYGITGLLNGDSLSVVSGTAIFTSVATMSSSVGQYPITYGSSTLSASNYTFVYIGATVTVTAADFVLTASPTTITMPAGQVATVTITLTPSGAYVGSVALSCGALPADVTCDFTPPTLVADGSGQIVQSVFTIATDNFQHISRMVPANKPGGGREYFVPFSLAALPLLLCCGWRKRKVAGYFSLTVLLLLAVSGITSCANATQNIAAKGTSTVTVTATGASGLSHNVALTLTLQ